MIVYWKENMSISVSCSTSLCECVPLPSPVHTVLVCKQRGVNWGQDCTKPQCFLHLFTSLSFSFLCNPAAAGRRTLRQRRPLRCMQAYWISPDWPPLLVSFFERTKREARCIDFCCFPRNVKKRFMHSEFVRFFNTFFYVAWCESLGQLNVDCLRSLELDEVYAAALF